LIFHYFKSPFNVYSKERVNTRVIFERKTKNFHFLLFFVPCRLDFLFHKRAEAAAPLARSAPLRFFLTVLKNGEGRFNFRLLLFTAILFVKFPCLNLMFLSLTPYFTE